MYNVIIVEDVKLELKGTEEEPLYISRGDRI